MTQSDQEVDETARADLIHQVGQALVDDAVVLPLFQFPNIAAWRTDQLSGPIDADAGNYRSAFNNLNKWEPAGGEIVIGAEQWPDCLNPVTECATRRGSSGPPTCPSSRGCSSRPPTATTRSRQSCRRSQRSHWADSSVESDHR